MSKTMISTVLAVLVAQYIYANIGDKLPKVL